MQHTYSIQVESVGLFTAHNSSCRKVMFSQACIIPSVLGGHAWPKGGLWQRGGMHGKWGMCGGEVHGQGGMHDKGGHAWQGTYMAGGMCGRAMHGKGACVVGGMCGRETCVAVGNVWHGGNTWWGDMCAGETSTEAGGTHPTGMHSHSFQKQS